ncbi:MAG: hypothetical protein ACXW0Z_02935 [Gemmatirosa sp.]
MANRDQNTSGSERDKHRDNDDARDSIGPEGRNDVKGDSKSEARGDARESIGNHARGTDTNPTGPEGNDRTRGRHDRHDAFDDDLARDNQRGHEAQGMSDLADDTRSGAAGMPFVQNNPVEGDDRHSWRSHARQGQAESPVELNHNEQPKKQEGHH